MWGILWANSFLLNYVVCLVAAFATAQGLGVCTCVLVTQTLAHKYYIKPTWDSTLLTLIMDPFLNTYYLKFRLAQ